MQFAIKTSKASRPRRTPGTASPVRKAARVQAATCHSQLAQPRKAWENPGRDSDHHSPAVTQATPARWVQKSEEHPEGSTDYLDTLMQEERAHFRVVSRIGGESGATLCLFEFASVWGVV